MGRDVVLVRQKGSDTPQLQDALAAIHHCYFIHGHQGLAELLVVQAVRGLTPAAFAGVEGIDGFLAEQLLHFLKGCLFFSAQEQQCVAVSHNGVGVVLVDGLELGLRLQHNARGDFPASDGGNELLEVGNLPDVGKLVDEASDVNGQASAVHIIRLFAEQVEHLGVDQADEEVEAGIGVGHDQEQGGTLVAQGVQGQLVIGCDLPQLLNVKNRQPCTAGDEDGLGRLA